MAGYALHRFHLVSYLRCQFNTGRLHEASISFVERRRDKSEKIKRLLLSEENNDKFLTAKCTAAYETLVAKCSTSK